MQWFRIGNLIRKLLEIKQVVLSISMWKNI